MLRVRIESCARETIMMRTQHTVVKPETVTWHGSLSETPSGIRVHCCGETSRKIPTRPQAVRRLIHKSRSSRGNVATVLCFTISPTYIESHGDELIAVYLYVYVVRRIAASLQIAPHIMSYIRTVHCCKCCSGS